MADETGIELHDLRRWLADTDQGLFSQWLSRLRTQYARQLIATHANWTVDAVADSCGFASRQSLIRALKREYDCTPSDLQQATM